MLRIKIQRNVDVERWVLYGSVTGEMVDELKQTWRSARNGRNGHRYVVDLVEVTLVDQRGEQALMEMMRDGASFIARGVYCRNLVETLTARCKQEA